MEHPTWIWFGLAILLAWGLVGLLQKLSTIYLSAEAALVWWVVGLVLVEPLMYRDTSVFHYSGHAITWGLLAGFLNTLGSWGLLASMKSGGKASIVVTLTALYPVIVIPLVPFL